MTFLSTHISRNTVAYGVVCATLLSYGCNNSGLVEGPKNYDDMWKEPVKVTKFFGCNSKDLDTFTKISDVQNSAGDAVGIEMSNGEKCLFEPVYKSAAGDTTTLSTSPGAYLLMEAITSPVTGETLVCFSNVQHHQEGSTASNGDPIEEIDSVTIECAYKSPSGAWRKGQTVVDPSTMPANDEWAAWIEEVKLGSEPGEFLIEYQHDRTFQFLNASNLGRTPEEGKFEIALTANQAGFNIGEKELVTKSFTEGFGYSYDDTL